MIKFIFAEARNEVISLNSGKKKKKVMVLVKLIVYHLSKNF